MALAHKRGDGQPVRHVCFYPLTVNANPLAAVTQLFAAATSTGIVGSDACDTGNNPLLLSFPTFRGNLTAHIAPRGGQTQVLGDGSVFEYNVTHSLAAIRPADILVLVISLEGFIPGKTGYESSVLLNKEAELFLACLKATGVPSIVGVVQGLDTLPVSKQSDAKKFVHRLFTTEFGEDLFKLVDVPYHSPAIYAALSSGDLTPLSPPNAGTLQLVRTLCSCSVRSIHWRDHRPYLLATGHEMVPPGGAGETQNVAVYGFIRGKPLNVHQLVTLPSGGVHRIAKISYAKNPFKALAPNVAAEPHFVPLKHDGCCAGSAYISASRVLGVCKRVTVLSSSDELEEAAMPLPEYQDDLAVVAEGAEDADQVWPTDNDIGTYGGTGHLPPDAGMDVDVDNASAAPSRAGTFRGIVSVV